MFTALARALAQFDDPDFRGVVLRSVAWSALGFIGLLVGSDLWLHTLLAEANGWWRWLAVLGGTVGTALLAFWLFLPVAAVIATLYIERIAAAVDRRFYPGLPAPRGASVASQTWDAIALGLRVLVLNLVGLVLALVLPGVGWILGWAVAAWAMGRGLFMAVAMRRMSRPEAGALYGRQRWVVVAVGAVLAAAALVPLLNLLVPVIGTAAMVHVLHQQFPRRFESRE